MAKNSNVPLSITLKAIDKVSSVTKKIDKSINKITFKRQRNELNALADAAGFNRIGNNITRITQLTKNLGSSFLSLGKKVTFTSLAFGGGTFALVNQFTNAGENLFLTSKKLGLSATNIQAWRFAASKADISAMTLDTALQRLGRRTGEFTATGKGTAAPAFAALGLEADVLSGKLNQLDDLFPAIIDKLGQFKDENMRNAIAMKLFDTEGVKLVNLAIDGSKGLEDMKQKFQSLNGEISENSINASVRFNDKLVNTQAAIAGVRNIVADRLLPVVEKLMERFTHLIVNRQSDIVLWADKLAKKLERLPSFLKTLRADFNLFMDRISPLIDIISKIIDKFGTFNTILAVIGTYTLLPVIASVVSLAVSIGSLGFSLFRTSATIGGSVLPKLKALLASLTILKVPLVFLSKFLAAIVGKLVLLAGKVALLTGAFAAVFKGSKKLGELLRDFTPLDDILAKIISVTDKVWILRKALDGIIVLGNSIDKSIDFVVEKAKELTGFGEEPQESKVVNKIIERQKNSNLTGNINVSFANAPMGMRTSSETSPNLTLDLDRGYEP